MPAPSEAKPGSSNAPPGQAETPRDAAPEDELDTEVRAVLQAMCAYGHSAWQL